ncbi:MAG: MscL family protein [Flavobacteriaceae bacterium]|nr:MscL family protein [Flavobacteriaceae bacterium]
MAIGIITDASFSSVVNVLVKNIILPPLSLMTDGINSHGNDSSLELKQKKPAKYLSITDYLQKLF